MEMFSESADISLQPTESAIDHVWCGDAGRLLQDLVDEFEEAGAAWEVKFAIVKEGKEGSGGGEVARGGLVKVWPELEGGGREVVRVGVE